ncbi:MAG: hypothetical protein PVH88_12150 [Ignavibacteria bacterium]|jgi:hypothetical protein
MGKIHTVYCKKILAALFFLLSFSMYNAQVVIEEEIEINLQKNANYNTLNKINETTLNLRIEMSFSTGSYPFPYPPNEPYTTGHVQGSINYRNEYSPNIEPYVYESSITGFVSIESYITTSMRNQTIITKHNSTDLGHSIGETILNYVGPGSSSVTITVSGAPSGKRIVINGEPINEITKSFDSYHRMFMRIRVGLEDESCEDYACEDNSPAETPGFGIKEININDYTNFDFCEPDDWEVNVATGMFVPLFDNKDRNIENELVDDLNLDICFNTSTESWQYTLPENKIYLNAALGVCEYNIEKFEVIKEYSELNSIPEDKICQALADFKLQATYGNLPNEEGRYFLYYATELHESIHKERFVDLIEEILKEEAFNHNYGDNLSFSELFRYLQPACEDYPDKASAKTKLENEFNKILKDFLTLVEKKDEKRRWNRKKNEGETHYHPDLQLLIQSYIEVLENIQANNYPDLNCG